MNTSLTEKQIEDYRRDGFVIAYVHISRKKI